LEYYGELDEVWVFADRHSISSDVPFTIALHYDRHGILAVYNGITDKGEKLQICPNTIIEDKLLWFLWSPTLILDFEEVGRYVLLFDTRPSDRPFFLLDDVTYIDAKIFYDTYLNPGDSNNCFDILYPTRNN